MSEDLVERLRGLYLYGTDSPMIAQLLEDAADEIESLRKQLAAFYRVSTQGISASTQRGQNVAQGQE